MTISIFSLFSHKEAAQAAHIALGGELAKKIPGFTQTLDAYGKGPEEHGSAWKAQGDQRQALDNVLRLMGYRGKSGIWVRKPMQVDIGFSGGVTYVYITDDNISRVKEFEDAVLKHLQGQHNQKRHGYRYGSVDAARRSMRGVNDPKERGEYRKRAGMPEPKKRAKIEEKPKKMDTTIEKHPSSDKHVVVKNPSGDMTDYAKTLVAGKWARIEKNGNLTIHKNFESKFRAMAAKNKINSTVAPKMNTADDLVRWSYDFLSTKAANYFQFYDRGMFNERYSGKTVAEINKMIDEQLKPSGIGWG